MVMEKKTVEKEGSSIFESRLEAYFKDESIKDGELQEAIKRAIGRPEHDYDEIMKQVDYECQETYDDADFESVLDNYSNVFSSDDAARIFDSICGPYGGTVLYLLKDLGMIEVKTY